MKWMETIKAKAASGREMTLETELMTLRRDVLKNSEFPGLLRAVLCKHVVVPGYFVLHLFWETEHPQNEGSGLGLRLAHSLKIFGIVDHSVWLGT
jgi:hypothetical protein